MKKRIILLYVILVLVLPQVLIGIVKMTDQRIKLNIESEKGAETNPVSSQRIISVCDQDVLIEIPLDEYVTGVVLGEMPADFEPEALKAQAVACRTFTLKSMQRSKHDGASLCTDPACCQAFLYPSDYEGSASNLEKIYSAIAETENEVIMFDGNLIEATYFSCSGGQTEAAVAVWGSDVPYLQSVDSPGEEISGNFETTETFSHSAFRQMLDLEPDMPLSENDIELDYTVGGGVDTISIGNVSFSGVQVRSLLNLRSTIFSIDFTDENVIVTTRGYGHRVGMSQYGAEAMAIGGSTYKEILQHYYVGTDLVRLSLKEMDAIFDKAENI